MRPSHSIIFLDYFILLTFSYSSLIFKILFLSSIFIIRKITSTYVPEKSSKYPRYTSASPPELLYFERQIPLFLKVSIAIFRSSSVKCLCSIL